MLKRLFSFRLLLGTSLLIAFVMGYWQWLALQQFMQTPLNLNGSQTKITVEPGRGLNQLARQWQTDGIISNAFYLRLFSRLNPKYQQIKVGEYQLKACDTPLSLLTMLLKGDVVQYAFTIVEGNNSFQLLSALAAKDNLQIDFPQSNQELSKLLSEKTDGASIKHIEGWLYPDTYHYAKGSSGFKLLQRAHRRMQQVLQEEWLNRADNLPYKSPYEALIMASIIEKETGVASERKQIAGVFVRRLNKRMRLQTDPTVIYGIGPDFNGDITYKNLREKTPYNTYVIKGLPPTPIAMPGRAAIHAALHPSDGTALYFVASGDGGHTFSDTLAEHNKALRRYLNRKK